MTNTKTNTKMKADYTSLSPQQNNWIQLLLLGVFVCVAYFGTIYHTNMNAITAPSVVVATTKTSLVRGGDGVGVDVGDGNGGQEDLSSTSVVDNIIEINMNTNTFGEEEDGLLGDCYSKSCTAHFGDEKAVRDKDIASGTSIMVLVEGIVQVVRV
eukprot:CAMPEP_0170954080 /NCGR_PEP_ID=MMETSP0735-20130129/32297_1 /TAXON_ID=186038 /ORGANISM="Fragilariopsis kerguelensis, Strain L26-C5" /LENGTH=154 /DNA_ID=CAMNT_0011365545 /DNA_START=12 /DNA_END=477 /DNA_ORIENTATION=-